MQFLAGLMARLAERGAQPDSKKPYAPAQSIPWRSALEMPCPRRSTWAAMSLLQSLPWLGGLALAGLIAGPAAPGLAQPAVEGSNSVRRRGDFVHDPSTIVKSSGEYWVFSTGPGVSSRHSKDLVAWTPGPPVFPTPPAWTTNAVPENRGYFWAPDVIHTKSGYFLYYSVSTWGKRTSAIGLATNATLDPADPKYGWKDAGLVIRSRETDDFNAIDPAVTRDADGNLWLAFGSYWSGLKLVQLDPATGLRLAPDAPIHPLAWHSSIEAAALFRHDAFYYLFVNWGECCRGTNSTYNIRVGRSPAITGPYTDKAGVDLLNGGGSLLLESAGAFIGPGHAGIFVEAGTNWFSCHFYDGRRRGMATLSVRPMHWGADGWPSVPTP